MDCHQMIDLGYQDFSNQLYEKGRPQRIPLNGSIELTARCNLRCVHCYLPLEQRRSPSPAELSLPEIERIFGEIAEAGCMWLLLTGGEPLLRPDFLQIYTAAKRQGFIVSLFTNGTLFNKAILDHLVEYRPFSIEITLYGATQASYERVTGIPGSFERCLHGIRQILDRSLPLQLKTVLLTLNYHELDLMKQFATELGVEFRHDAVINAGIDGNLAPTRLRLSPEQIIEIESHEEKLVQAWLNNHRNNLDLVVDRSKLYLCTAGRSGFHIDSEGRASVCLSARDPSFDLRQGSFRQCWEEFFPAVLQQEYSRDYECRDCKLRPVCAQCPAMGMSEWLDAEKRVPFICELAHRRYAAFYQELALL